MPPGVGGAGLAGMEIMKRRQRHGLNLKMMKLN